MLNRSNLHAYQERAIEFIKTTKRCLLTLDMGLGKTVSTLTTISDLKQEGLIRKVLIVAPLRVANTVWKQEADNWDHLKHIKINICTGKEQSRIEALCNPADIYVINRENVPWLVKKTGLKWPYDMVIIDESSSFKSHKSLRFKAIKMIIGKVKYVTLLTGTPTPNGLLDLWAQFYLVDMGEALGKNLFVYRNRFFDSDYMGYNWTLKAKAADEIYRLISPKCLSMKAEDYLELPTKINLVQWVNLPRAVQANYLQFEKTLLADLPQGQELKAENAAILANKLLQMANGHLYDENKLSHFVHSEKIDMLEECVENLTENVLIAYNFKQDLETIKSRFKYAKILDNNPQTVQDWNEGKIKMLLAHPASCGHGLNLQKGGSLIIWYGLNWSLELYQQLNGRLYRQGQTKPVRIIHIMARGTYDERVMARLGEKDITQQNLIDSLIR